MDSNSRGQSRTRRIDVVRLTAKGVESDAQSHCWAHTPRKPDLKETRVPSVHRSTVYNSQDMEATQMPICRQMDKEAVVHIHHGILLSHLKEYI